jgi:hypothetical protein
VATRVVAPVHHDHVGGAGHDQRIDERHPGRARSDDQIVGLDPARDPDLTTARIGS